MNRGKELVNIIFPVQYRRLVHQPLCTRPSFLVISVLSRIPTKQRIMFKVYRCSIYGVFDVFNEL